MPGQVGPEPVHDSPVAWVAGHVRRYSESGGASGHDYHGLPTLLLTTRGRRSGLLRRTALIYGRDAGGYVVAASNGGEERHPAWYLNLLADPAVDLQVRAETFPAVARPATEPERQRWWPLMTGIFPRYLSYQRGTPRQIPLVLLQP